MELPERYRTERPAAPTLSVGPVGDCVVSCYCQLAHTRVAGAGHRWSPVAQTDAQCDGGARAMLRARVPFAALSKPRHVRINTQSTRRASNPVAMGNGRRDRDRIGGRPVDDPLRAHRHRRLLRRVAGGALAAGDSCRRMRRRNRLPLRQAGRYRRGRILRIQADSLRTRVSGLRADAAIARDRGLRLDGGPGPAAARRWGRSGHPRTDRRSAVTVAA